MKKLAKSKRYFSILLALLLFVSSIGFSNPVAVKADEYKTSVALSEDARVSEGCFTDYDEVCAYLRGQLAARTENITFSVATEVVASLDSVYDFYDDAMAYYTGCANGEGDTLINEVAMSSIKVYDYGTYKTFETTVSYYTDAEQEAELNYLIKQTISNMQLAGKSDYEKVRIIFDYVCSHVDYDYEHLEDDTYLRKHTAYAAMIDGTAVCQGYAVLFYRMCIEAGVDCRVILGLGNGGAHAWNIVKIGNYWYNVDSTWDGSNEAATHNWFLLNESDFLNHTRNSEYASEKFCLEYPIALESWKDYGKAVELPNHSNLSEYNYHTINDGIITNQANGRPKILIFFRNTCGNSRYTIKSICDNTPEGMDIIAINADTASKESVTEFRDTYGNNNIEFVYAIDGYTYNSSHSFAYYRLFSAESSYILPLIVYIDADNRVQHYTTSAVSASGLKAIVSDYCFGGMNWILDAQDTMSAGSDFQAKILLNNIEKNQQFFQWESSNTNVASVDFNGKITALNKGTTVIKCKLGDTVLSQKEITVTKKGVTGLQLIDGKWYYCVDGEVNTEKTGLVQSEDGTFWYVIKGELAASYTGFVENGAGNWYVVGGKIDITFTGLGKDQDEAGNIIWRCVINGKEYPNYTGLIQNAGYFWYIKDGAVDTSYTGFYENEHGKWYVVTGKIDTSYTGLGRDGDKWLCVQAGKYNGSYTGLVQNAGNFWYVENGVLNTGFSGIAETGGSRWLVGTGKLNSSYTGTYKDATGTYNIVNGKVIE